MNYSNFNDINIHIISYIYQFLNINDLYNCSVVSKKFNRTFYNNAHWITIFKNEYDENIEIYKKLFNLDNNLETVKKYIQIHKTKKSFFNSGYDDRNIALFYARQNLNMLPGLEKLPVGICNLINLRALYLYKGYIKEVPKEIGKLYNLETLELFANKINNIPKEIGDLINLRTLRLDLNSITKIPKEIGRLINLKLLYLQQNVIESIPIELGNLYSLTKLDLSMNNIKEIPKELGKLINLQQLRLSSNYRIQRLPEELGNLINLRYLDVYYSDINEIPPSIMNIGNLRIQYGRNIGGVVTVHTK